MCSALITMSQSFVVRRAGDATGSSSPKRGAASGNRGRRHNEPAVRGRGRSRKRAHKRKRERRAAAPDAAEVEAASTKRGTSSGSEHAVTVNGVTGTRAAAMSTQGACSTVHAACNGFTEVLLSLVDDVVCGRVVAGDATGSSVSKLGAAAGNCGRRGRKRKRKRKRKRERKHERAAAPAPAPVLEKYRYF